ncbi:hypothetical protein GCM10023080_079970 [Streptomyces pseudoechinosporeus]
MEGARLGADENVLRDVRAAISAPLPLRRIGAQAKGAVESPGVTEESAADVP